MKNKWTLYDYDVWGNEYDGWEVNDTYKVRGELEIPDSDNDIINMLFDIGYLNDAFRFKGAFRLDWIDDGWCEIVYCRNEEPLGKLVRENN